MSDGALHHATGTREVRLLDVQEREADQRTDVHPRPCDLDQPGVHEHLDTAALERPRQLAEVGEAGRVVAGHRDGVAAELFQHRGDVAQVAEDRHLEPDEVGQLGVGHADADDGQAAPGLVRQALDELARGGGAARDHHAADEPAGALLAVQDLGGHEPAAETQDDGEGGARDRQLEQGVTLRLREGGNQLGTHGPRDHDGDPRPEHRAHLVRPHADRTPLVAPHGRDRERPDHGTQGTEHGDAHPRGGQGLADDGRDQRGCRTDEHVPDHQDGDVAAGPDGEARAGRLEERDGRRFDDRRGSHAARRLQHPRRLGDELTFQQLEPVDLLGAHRSTSTRWSVCGVAARPRTKMAYMDPLLCSPRHPSGAPFPLRPRVGARPLTRTSRAPGGILRPPDVPT